MLSMEFKTHTQIMGLSALFDMSHEKYAPKNPISFLLVDWGPYHYAPGYTRIAVHQVGK